MRVIISVCFLTLCLFITDKCSDKHNTSRKGSGENNSFLTKESIKLPKQDLLRVKKDFFSYSIPNFMKEQTSKGVESKIWFYTGKEISFYVEAGLFVNNLENLQKNSNYKEKWELIDEQRAKIISFNYDKNFTNLEEPDKKNVLAIYFPQGDKVRTNVSFWFSFQKDENLPTAIQIIKSIKFD